MSISATRVLSTVIIVIVFGGTSCSDQVMSPEVVVESTGPSIEPTAEPATEPTVVGTAEPAVVATAEPAAASTAVPTVVPTVAPSTTPTPQPADAAQVAGFSREESIEFLVEGGLDEDDAACITDGSYERTGSWDLRVGVSSAVEEELATMAFACIESNAKPTPAPSKELSSWLSDAGLLDTASRADLYPSSPPNVLVDDGTYEAVITTADGAMRFVLFASEAPVAVNSFLNLASDGYYDGVTFHRVIADFMAQGGDPTGTGAGGPGYEFINEYTPGIEFDRRGQLAMANAGPDTNGSQFFITYTPLDFLEASDYTIFGQLVEGDGTLSAIEFRDPATAVDPGTTITSIRVTETG